MCSEAMWRMMAEKAHPFMCVIDRSGKVLFANHSIGGASRGKAVGSSLYSLVPEGHRAGLRKAVRGAIESGGRVCLETVGAGANGSRLWNENCITPVAGGAVVFVHDITERKKAEEARLADEQRYHAFLDTATDLMFITDEKGNFTYVNKAAKSVVGYSAEEMMGMNIEDVLPDDYDKRDFRPLWLDYLRTGVLKYDMGFKAKGGSKVLGTLRVTAKHGSGGEYSGGRGVFHDLTERTRMEEALKEANAKLKADEELRESFLNNIAHELKTPLTVMKLNIERLARREGRQVDEYRGTKAIGMTDNRELLGDLIRNTDRFSNTIRRLLHLSRLESGAIIYHKAAIDVDPLVDGMWADFAVLAKSKGIYLKRSIGRVPQVFADAEYLGEALRNLLGNAIKFTDRGGVTLTVRRKGASVVFEVADTGIGIPKESVGGLFRRFYRAENGLDRAHGGTGLGLAIAKATVEDHGGRIWCESKVGEGSKFIFTLPVSKRKVRHK